MCYSFEANISAWITSFILCMYMLTNPEKYPTWMPLMILTFTQIQIMEAIIWTSMDKNQDVNEKATKLLFFMLWLQPMMYFLIGYKATSNEILLYGTFFYTLILVYLGAATQNDKFISTVGPNGHLQWNRYNKDNKKIDFIGNVLFGSLYLMGIFLPLYLIGGTISSIAILYAAITFSFDIYKYKHEFGSMWCFTAVGLSILPILCIDGPLMIKN